MIREKNVLLGFGVAAVLLLGSVSVAHAQYGAPPPGYGYPPPPPRGMYRDGFLIGGSLGFGDIAATNCGDTCGVGFSAELHLGGMVNPRLGVMADFWGIFRSIPNSDASISNSISTAAVQYWVTDIIWLKGGIGFGHVQISSNTVNVVYGDESGLALLGAGGIELVQSGNFALDLQLRLGHAFYSQGGDINNVAINIGVNWY